jgi:hypothetical protein
MLLACRLAGLSATEPAQCIAFATGDGCGTGIRRHKNHQAPRRENSIVAMATKTMMMPPA